MKIENFMSNSHDTAAVRTMKAFISSNWNNEVLNITVNTTCTKIVCDKNTMDVPDPVTTKIINNFVIKEQKNGYSVYMWVRNCEPWCYDIERYFYETKNNTHKLCLEYKDKYIIYVW